MINANRLQIITFIVVLLVMAGCVPQVKLVFRCADNINEGFLLPVDIISVSQEEEKAILQIGPEAWFESEYRSKLTKEQLVKIAINSGKITEIAIDIPQKKSVVIIFADYMEITEQNPQQLIIHHQKWRGYVTGEISVGKKGLQMMK